MLQNQQTKSVENERKVTAWATSLERLLNDTVGLHAFAVSNALSCIDISRMSKNTICGGELPSYLIGGKWLWRGDDYQLAMKLGKPMSRNTSFGVRAYPKGGKVIKKFKVNIQMRGSVSHCFQKIEFF